MFQFLAATSFRPAPTLHSCELEW